MPKVVFDSQQFCATVKVWRRMNDFTIADLAELVKIPRSTLAFIENGDRCPTIAELSVLCSLMDFDVADFFKSPRKG